MCAGKELENILNSPLVEKGDFITEPQFYKLAIKANNETAERFQDWVTNDVLPNIRKNGMYATPKTIDDMLSNPDTMIEILQRYKDSQLENQRLHDENTIVQPKALFADAVASSHTTILVGELAKLLKQNGIDIKSRSIQLRNERLSCIERVGLYFIQFAFSYIGRIKLSNCALCLSGLSTYRTA